MIDKVEVRVPAKTDFSRDFGKLYRDLHYDPDLNPFRASRHYLSVGDLRRFGHQAILHMGCVRDKEGNHKLELVDTGAMTHTEMREEVESIFDTDARGLALMRLDLAADVRGVSVSWFMGHVRARWKRFVSDIGQMEEPKLEYTRMGRQKVETIYFGKRPNCFRIYDKIAEYRHQYGQMMRGLSDAAEVPTFETLYGYPETGFTLTRVERQIGGSRVPPQVDTFGKLGQSPEFNPFDKLTFLASASAEPQIEEYGLNRYAFGMWLRDQIEENGIHRVRALLNKHSGGHASRILSDYQAFLPEGEGIDGNRLFEIYQESVSRQLAA